MTSIWILEKWLDREKETATLADFRQMLTESNENGEMESLVEKLTDSITVIEDRLANPDYTGRWQGWQGKINYKQFIACAKESILFDRQHEGGNGKFRVVKAELDADSKYWAGQYVNPVENSGVLRYLYTIC